jgi:hypothetical protein
MLATKSLGFRVTIRIKNQYAATPQLVVATYSVVLVVVRKSNNVKLILNVENIEGIVNTKKSEV